MAYTAPAVVALGTLSTPTEAEAGFFDVVNTQEDLVEMVLHYVKDVVMMKHLQT
jgi:hypothetical protein